MAYWFNYLNKADFHNIIYVVNEVFVESYIIQVYNQSTNELIGPSPLDKGLA